MPTRRLPARPSLTHLKDQAADLLKAHAQRQPQALQRLREFHPRMRTLHDERIAQTQLKLSDAYLAIAREYGFPSWPKLKAFVERGDAAVLENPAHERIEDQTFRRAVDLLDAGDVAGLRAHLAEHPNAVRQHVTLYGGNYFTSPTLLEFVAENPTRRGSLPPNIADVARVILDAGAKDDRAALDSALSLVASSAVARESGVQPSLIAVLCEYGADTNAATVAPLLYGEFDAVQQLLEQGAPVTLPVAAALGCDDDVRRLLTRATDTDKALALALAAQHGCPGAAQVLLQAGADAKGFTPPQGHAHATPLHQAALAGQNEIAQMLLEYGASRETRDILYNATPAEWAQHAGFGQLAERLQPA